MKPALTEIEMRLWRNSTSKIFKGLLILTVFGLVASITETLYGILDTGIRVMNHVDELPDPSAVDSLSDWHDVIGVVMRVFEVLALAGWIAYIMGLSKFRKAQITEEARKNAGVLYAACWIGLISVFLYCLAGFFGLFGILFRFLGWVSLLVSLARFFEASEALSQETSWNAKARRGAKNLRVSYVLAIILQLLPIIMGIVLFFAVSGAISNFWRIIYAIGTSGYEDLYGYASWALVFLKFFGLSIVVVWVLEMIFLFVGWNRIRIGGLELPSSSDL